MTTVSFKLIRNRDRYTKCASCRATAHGFLYIVTGDGEHGGTSVCQRHIPTWQRRLTERHVEKETQ